MRFFKISIIAMCLGFCFFISNAAAADLIKIGVIDLQKILSTSDSGKEAQSKITAKGKEMQADLQKKAADIQEDQQRYERESTVMSEDARTEKERELKIKKLDFDDLETKYKSDFSTYNQTLVNQFKKDVLAVVEQIGKKEGYTLVLEKSSGGVVYAPSTIDLTDQVIQQLNENFAKTSKKASE